MKTQILSRGNVLISLIGFLLLVEITRIGCGVFVNRVRKLDVVKLDMIKLDVVVLTQDDLPMMQVTSIDPIGFLPSSSVIARSVIVGFEQWWSGDLTVRYWLFDAASTAKKVAETGAHHISALEMNWQPERNPKDVIGDGTWCHTRSEQNEWEYSSTHIVFVKNNVLVHVMAGEHLGNHLQFARDVARKIEAKITAVLEKE